MKEISSFIFFVSILISFSAVIHFYIFFYVNDNDSFDPSHKAVLHPNNNELATRVDYKKEKRKNDFMKLSAHNHILPKHTILVTGLESSGTKYISSALAIATANFRNQIGGMENSNKVELLHHSLPHGTWCTIFGNQLENMTLNNLTKVFESWTVPFIPPSHCSCDVDMFDESVINEKHNSKKNTRVSGKGHRWMKMKEIEDKLIETGDSKEWDRRMKIRAKRDERKTGTKLSDMEQEPDSMSAAANSNQANIEESDFGNSFKFKDQSGMISAIFKPFNKLCDTWKTNDDKYGGNTQESCATLGINKPIESPPRHFVNISSHIKWYQQHGVRATAVVVVREQTIELISKHKEYCHNKKVSEAENEYAKRFILDAFSNLSQEGPSPSLVFVSYETLVAIGETYLKTQIYPKLGIDVNKSIFIPPIHDSNEPYVLKNYTKPPKRERRDRAARSADSLCEDRIKTHGINSTKVIKMKYHGGACITLKEYERRIEVEKKYQEVLHRKKKLF